MTHADRISDAELDVLLECGRQVRRVPDVVRARALARARATIAADAAGTPETATTYSHGRGWRIAVAAALALLVGAAGAVAAVRSGAFARFAPALPPAVRAATPARITTSEPALPPQIAPQPAPIARPERAPRPAIAQESYTAELGMLQRAQVAYARRNFSAALVLASEHARRFPNGRLAEEREALRVRSLASAGRAGEARRATASFAARFPRSVLLPRLQKLAGAAE